LFLFQTQNDDKTAEEMTVVLQGGIQGFLRKKFSPPNLAELYRSSHKMVFTHDQGEQIYDLLRQELASHLQTKVREAVVASFDQKFLKILDRAWSDHQSAMVMLRDILMPLETVYIPKSDPPVETIKCLCWIVFREEIIFYQPVRDHLRDILLKMIAKGREGDKVDCNAIKDACQMLIALGTGDRWVYEEVFEKKFLEAFKEFSCSADVSKVAEEIEKAKLYLDEVTVELMLERVKK
jgi:cullin 3